MYYPAFVYVSKGDCWVLEKLYTLLSAFLVYLFVYYCLVHYVRTNNMRKMEQKLNAVKYCCKCTT